MGTRRRGWPTTPGAAAPEGAATRRGHRGSGRRTAGAAVSGSPGNGARRCSQHTPCQGQGGRYVGEALLANEPANLAHRLRGGGLRRGAGRVQLALSGGRDGDESGEPQVTVACDEFLLATVQLVDLGPRRLVLDLADAGALGRVGDVLHLRPADLPPRPAGRQRRGA